MIYQVYAETAVTINAPDETTAVEHFFDGFRDDPAFVSDWEITPPQVTRIG